MAEKEIQNPVVTEILKKMCEFANVKYEDITWTDQSHRKIEYTPKQLYLFVNWLGEHFFTMTIKDLGFFVGEKSARLYYKRKKKAVMLAMKFAEDFGFKVKEEEKTDKKEKDD